jgi:hypothetical protein
MTGSPTIPRCAYPVVSTVLLPLLWRHGCSKGIIILQDRSGERADPIAAERGLKFPLQLRYDDFHGLADQRLELRQLERISHEQCFDANGVHRAVSVSGATGLSILLRSPDVSKQAKMPPIYP